MDYYMTIDTETANSLDDPIVYDLGIVIHDKDGNVYYTQSLVLSETFLNEELMKTAYFANKIEQYKKDLYVNHTRKPATIWGAWRLVKSLLKRYNVKAVIAHNAYFDFNALNTTLRYYTQSRYRYFFPFGTVIWDSLRMARTTLSKDEPYKEWCVEHDYLTNGRPKMTAEVLYRYITSDHAFMEEHTGLADAMIEKEITAYLLNRNHAGKRKCLFNPKKDEDVQTMLEWLTESSLME